MSPLTYSAKEAAKALGVSEWLVRRLEAEGTLPGIRLGRRLVFSKAEIAAFLQGQRSEVAS